MPPSRFIVSPFKNSLPAAPTDKSLWYHALPLSADTALVAASDDWIIASSQSVGGLIAVRWESVGKTVEDKSGGEWNALGGRILSLAVSREGVVAVGGQGGVKLWSLPASSESAPFSPSSVITLPSTSAVTSLAFHPTTPSILLSSTATSVSIWDVSSSKHEPALVLEPFSSKGLWSICWSFDGRLVGAIGRDGKLGVWEPRKGLTATVSSAAVLNALKQAHIEAFTDKFLVTGFSKSRERILALFDPVKLDAPLAGQTLDFETAPLIPLVDNERRIVYLSGKGEMTLRYTEVSASNTFSIGAVILPFAIAAVALTPPTRLDVMAAEINRILVVGKGQEILPVPVRVPKRHYIDYAPELFPHVRASEPAQSAQQWLDGGDAVPDLLNLDPSKRKDRKAGPPSAPASAPAPGPEADPAKEPGIRASANPRQLTASSQPVKPVESPSPPSEISAAPAVPEPLSPARTTKEVLSAPVVEHPKPISALPPAAAPAASLVSSAPFSASAADAATLSSKKTLTETSKPLEALVSTPEAAPVPLTMPTPTPAVAKLELVPVSASAASANPSVTPVPARSPATKPSAPAPRWSRNFLSGSSPLLPAYDNLSCLSTSHPPDALLLQASLDFLFFPISGPGGRLAVHSVEKRGRLPLQPDFPCLGNGSEIVDFVVDPTVGSNGETRISTAGEDGLVKVWSIPKGGIEGLLGEAEKIIHAKGLDKIAKLAYNPVARDILAVLSNDLGEGFVRIINTATGEAQQPIKVDGGGVFTAAWSPSGSSLAIACKDRRIRVVPAQPATSAAVASTTGPAHVSPRSFQLAWLDDSHLVTVGFGSGSQRELVLHEIGTDLTIERKSTLTMEVSPSVLFPVFDRDTSILFLWGKGERTISGFDVNLDAKAPFTRLPQFAGALSLGITFLPKTTVNVRAVEIMKGYRLTQKTIEEISFKIPRNKVAFFQDDVFPPTRLPPSVSASAWLQGSTDQPGVVDLRPEDMKPLSEAPKPPAVAKSKPEMFRREKSAAESAQASMDAMFERAKRLAQEEEAMDGPRERGEEEWSD